MDIFHDWVGVTKNKGEKKNRLFFALFSNCYTFSCADLTVDFNKGIARLEKMGEAMMKTMKSSALEVRVGCDARVMETGDVVDALEMKVAAFKSMPECTPAAGRDEVSDGYRIL